MGTPMPIKTSGLKSVHPFLITFLNESVESVRGVARDMYCKSVGIASVGQMIPKTFNYVFNVISLSLLITR